MRSLRQNAEFPEIKGPSVQAFFLYDRFIQPMAIGHQPSSVLARDVR